MQTHPPPLRNGYIYMIDVHSAESNEKLYFRFFIFLFFVLWLIAFTIYDDTSGALPTLGPPDQVCHRPNERGVKFTGMVRIADNNFLVLEFFFVRLLVFKIWSILMYLSMQNRPFIKSDHIS